MSDGSRQVGSWVLLQAMSPDGKYGILAEHVNGQIFTVKLHHNSNDVEKMIALFNSFTEEMLDEMYEKRQQTTN